MVATRTPPSAERLPILKEPPSVHKSFSERLDAIENLLLEARLLMKELKEDLR